MCFVTKRWNYYPRDPNAKQKVTIDAIWVFKYIQDPWKKSNKIFTQNINTEYFNTAQRISGEQVKNLVFKYKERYNLNIKLSFLGGRLEGIEDKRKKDDEDDESKKNKK